MIAHFVVSTVAGVMMTACQKAIPPRDAQGASVGLKSPRSACEQCLDVVEKGWVTFQ